MTDTLRPVASHRLGRRLGWAGTLAAVVAAGAAGFAAGRDEPTMALRAQEVRTATVRDSSLTSVPSYSPIVDQVAPAVVTVRVERRLAPMETALPPGLRDFFGDRLPRPDRGPAPRTSGLGSGVVLRSDGHIVTNAHVVGDAERVQVEFSDLRTLPARVIGVDEASDLAVLKVDADGLPTVPLGDSSQVKVGDVVLALGNPLGVGQTVTMGIVSAKSRTTGPGDGSYQDFIQTDAPINQGNSGGALVNLSGELVGINAQILSRTGGNIGLGFAIPAEMVRSVTDQLIAEGVVHRSRLGVTAQALTAELAAGLGLEGPGGALVGEVEADSPAARGGLRAGDVIVALDGRTIADANALRNQVAAIRPGSVVAIDVLRDGGRQQLQATLVGQKASARAASVPRGEDGSGESRLGVAVEPMTPDLASRLDLPGSAAGLVVVGVDPDGPAAAAGLREGDVITSANGVDVDTAASLRTALAGRAGRPAVLRVTRDGRGVFVAVPERS